MPHSFPPRRFSDLEDQRRDEGAALLGVVGRLRPDDAADIALAELRAVLGALHGVGVGDPVDHRAADTGHDADQAADAVARSEEHTSELQSLMRISYDVFCLKKKNKNNKQDI